MADRFSIHLSLFLLLFGAYNVQPQDECTLPSVVLRYGLLSPQELNPATGSSIVLTCESGSETNFVWQKDTNELLNTGASFVIASVAAGDGGVYRCGVVECNDTVFSNQIVINTVPAISLLMGPESPVVEGGVVTLFCSAQGWPTPTYTWLFEGSIVSMSQTYTISSTTPAQEGTYQCAVINNRGEDTGNHTVSVIAWPTFATPDLESESIESTDSTTLLSTQFDDSTAPSYSSEDIHTRHLSTVLPSNSTDNSLSVDPVLLGVVVATVIILTLLACLSAAIIIIVLLVVRSRRRKTQTREDVQMRENAAYGVRLPMSKTTQNATRSQSAEEIVYDTIAETDQVEPLYETPY